MTEYVEMTEYLAACLAEADEQIDALSDQLRKAEHDRQKLLDKAVAEIAEFTVGQEVLSYGKRYRVTKVSGEQFGLTGNKPKVWLRYSGEKLKVSGEPMGREKRLYEISALTDSETAEDLRGKS